MSEVFAVVEGLTEQTFVRESLAPWLANRGVFLHASQVGKPGHKGGNVYEVAKRDMMNFLKQRLNTFVTCFFDFYAMKDDWPGREEANTVIHDRKPVTVEEAIKQDVVTTFEGSLREDRLIPYVQMHEFESLLFSRPLALSKTLGEEDSRNEFQEIRDEFKTPEHINDDPNTAPSKRIIKIFKSYRRGYKKPLHGSITAKAITIDTMYEECPHFQAWIDALVELGA